MTYRFKQASLLASERLCCPCAKHEGIGVGGSICMSPLTRNLCSRCSCVVNELHDTGRKFPSHQDQDIFLLRLASFESRNSSVILVTKIGIGQPRKCVSIRRTNSELFSSTKPPDRRGHPCSTLSNGYQGLFSIKRPDSEAENSHQLVPRLRIRGAITPLPQMIS